MAMNDDNSLMDFIMRVGAMILLGVLLGSAWSRPGPASAAFTGIFTGAVSAAPFNRRRNRHRVRHRDRMNRNPTCVATNWTPPASATPKKWILRKSKQ